jgi:hypothetical protein
MTWYKMVKQNWNCLFQCEIVHAKIFKLTRELKVIE